MIALQNASHLVQSAGFVLAPNAYTRAGALGQNLPAEDSKLGFTPRADALGYAFPSLDPNSAFAVSCRSM